jgi:hypothetical protein
MFTHDGPRRPHRASPFRCVESGIPRQLDREPRPDLIERKADDGQAEAGVEVIAERTPAVGPCRARLEPVDDGAERHLCKVEEAEENTAPLASSQW